MKMKMGDNEHDEAVNVERGHNVFGELERGT